VQEGEEVAEAAAHVEHPAAVEVAQLEQRLEALLLRRALPVAEAAWAFAVSGVRSDGTLLFGGAGGRPYTALVWVVRNP
jgi:hypothetical protein